MLIFLIITFFSISLGRWRCCGAYYGDGELARLEYYSVKHMTYWSSSEYGNGNDADNDWSLSFQSGWTAVCESSTIWGGFKFVYPQTKFSQVTINVPTYLVGCAYLMPKLGIETYKYPTQ